MSVNRIQIGKVISSIVFLILLMAPMVVKLSHLCDLCELHKNEHCELDDTIGAHLHQKASDCEICDFHFVSFDTVVFYFDETTTQNSANGPINHFESVTLNSFTLLNTRLRAPPHILA